MSGSSTLATNLAGRCARSARPIWLGVLAGLLLLGGAPAAWAQTSVPTDDHLYAGCVLNEGVADAIRESIADSADVEVGDVDLSFIVVYAVLNTNNGQQFSEGGESSTDTGPVVCIDQDAVTIQTNQGGEGPPIREDTPIGDSEDPVDVKSADEALVLRYDTTFGATRDRFCHTVEGNVDCVDIGTLGGQ